MLPMHQSKLFTRTRWRLSAWYAAIIGALLSLSGLAFYEMLAQAHWHALHLELESLSGTLHDGLEPILMRPGQLEPEVKQLLPELCLANEDCLKQTEPLARHILGKAQRHGYYVRFLDPSGHIIATVGWQPKGLPFQTQAQDWQTLKDDRGQRYHQISLLLKTKSNTAWGYMQVGRSLSAYDDYLAMTRLVLLIGLPAALVLTSGASWWLAGLAMRPIYQSYQKIQQFTADAAHELRTPLAATQATIESVLEAETLSESEARKTLCAVERQNNRLTQLVQDLLLLSRMDRQEIMPKQQPCCLKTLVYDVVDEFEGLAIASELQLSLEIQVQQSLFVWGDEEQLYRLVANLVTNAIQYTPKGGTVALLLHQSDHHAVIQVKDTGIGIPAPEHSQIFERFYRVDSNRARITGGSGLGLAIAMAIAHAHQGTIQVQSQLGQGSTFTVKLPVTAGNP
ncbi:two-component system sensor histidine kinase RppB [Altericista sp. CCNU0014]|uniref:two-component system sensor histidine kinase RppB n=1 Tax=Altericista sp. CCNU0014 TaxID=3082949 RepID=UPI00384DDE51